MASFLYRRSAQPSLVPCSSLNCLSPNTSLSFLAAHVADLVVLPGSGQGEVASGALVGLGRLVGMPVVVVATMDRRSFGKIDSEGQHFLRLSIATGAADLAEASRIGGPER